MWRRGIRPPRDRDSTAEHLGASLRSKRARGPPCGTPHDDPRHVPSVDDCCGVPARGGIAVALRASPRPRISWEPRGSPVGAPWDTGQELSTLIWPTGRGPGPSSRTGAGTVELWEGIVMFMARTVDTMCGNGNRRFGPPKREVSGSGAPPAQRQLTRQCQRDVTSLRAGAVWPSLSTFPLSVDPSKCVAPQRIPALGAGPDWSG